MTYFGYRGRHRFDEPQDPYTGPLYAAWYLDRYPI